MASRAPTSPEAIASSGSVVPLATAFHDLAVYHELSLPSWRRLLDAVGLVGLLPGDAFTVEGVWTFITTNPAAQVLELRDALDTLEALGSEAGLEAVFAAAADGGVDLRDWPEIDSVMELALRLWLDARADDSVAQLLRKARLQAQGIRRRRRLQEYAGKEPRPLLKLDKPHVVERVRAWCETNRRGNYVSAMASKHGPEHRIEILHGHLLTTVLTISDRPQRRANPEQLKFRPAHADHIRYDEMTGRLSIACRSATLVTFYRELMGEVVAGDHEFFSQENVCSLRPLQEQGAAALARNRHSVAAIRDASVRELTWLLGDDRIRLDGDVFRALRHLRVEHLREGQFLEARIDVSLVGKARSVTVIVRVPKTIEIRGAGHHEPLVEQFLTEVGIRGVFGDGEGSSKPDVWDLFPWAHAERLWRRAVGAEQFDRLKGHGYFRSVSKAMVSHPDHESTPAALSVQPIDADTTYGVSIDEDVNSRTLTLTDTTGYELRAEVVLAEIQRHLALSETPNEIGLGLWALGRRAFSSSLNVAVYVALRVPPADTADRIRAHQRSARAVLLVPSGRRSGLRGVEEVDCVVIGGAYGRALFDIIEALDIRGQVDPELAVLPGTRVIIHRGRSSVAIDGHVLSTVAPGSKPFKFIEALAFADRELVTKAQMCQALSPNARESDPEEPKKVKQLFMKAVKASYAAASLPVPSDLDEMITAGGGYRLTFQAAII